jgi:sugar phosphate isomerase/epimerase
MPTFAAEPGKAAGFPVSLNTSTLRGHKLPLVEVIEIAAKAGYDGIEPWPNELDDYVAGGGSLADLRQRLKDRNLAVTGAIAFFRWMVDDDAARAEALEEAKRRIEQLHAIGATHVAAPPSGDVKNVDLLRAAERYRKLLDLAEGSGVVPAVEIWGPAPNLHRLGQAVLVALEAQHPRACILPDVFHVYRGGSSFEEFRLLSGGIIGGFHMNDYPASPPRAELKDAHRVYPGDGVGPVAQLFRDLRAIGYSGAVSVELFNPEYYKQDPALVAKTALEKTRAVMRAALEG